jgi:transketolase
MYKIKGNTATKNGFREGLVEIAEKNKNVLALGADITSSVGMDKFAKTFPERFFSFGIAEQNIAAVAAGMALSDKIPFFSTYGVFAALRCADQIRISICYNNIPVKIGGAHAGISVGPDGATHQALEDISIMRTLPNMTVLSPCDATQTKLATIASVNQVNGPCYIRFGRAEVPDFTSEDQEFIVGKGQVLLKGTDVSIIATGHMVWEALEAAKLLKQNSIHAQVINIHTIKPIDKELIIESAKTSGAIVTAEEHQIIGGLGSAVSEILSQYYPVPIRIIGMPDCFGESGKPKELMDKYGLNAKNIVSNVMDLVNPQ